MLARSRPRFPRLLSSRMSSSFVNRPRPVDWKTAAPAPLPQTTTFAGQARLAKLPVPNLQASLSKLKDSLKPIAWSAEEYSAAVAKIDKFEAGLGPELQNRLLNRASSTPHWLETWWDDNGYLGYRDSVVINVSYYYGFDAQPAHLRQTPAARAAGLARAAMIFRQKLKLGQIEPEKTKEGPMCMDTYRWMFDCCRLPAEGLDWSISYAKEGETGNTGHIVIIRNNRFYRVDVARDGRILSTDEIEKQIQHIYDNTVREYPAVGVLTASNRDVWAKDFAELVAQPENAQILGDVFSSAFIISLESSRPSDPIHHSRALWHGDVVNNVPVGLRNRWVDKPVQFIVFDNAAAGIMGEHSVMDGTPTARMCDNILDWLADPAFDHGSPSGDAPPQPTPLDWKVTPALTKAIEQADKAAVELVTSQDMTYHLTSYGKAAIKAFGVSPDSWAQMIVQLAYRRFLGDSKRTGGTYEAATTRKFYKGRTEAIRVVSSESDAWVASMDDPSASNETRKKLFDAATKKHITLAKQAGNGEGFDRHLYGLRLLLNKDEQLPEMYQDPVYTRATRWVLSTSAVFSKHFPVYGWGEVVPDGFGVAYMTGYDDRLQFTITSRKEIPNARFMEEVKRAANDLYALHTHIQSAKAKL